MLLGTTLAASFLDSLNPSAIAQQMVLQAMVREKRHTWFYIAGLGAANLALGLVIYYGMAQWAAVWFARLSSQYPGAVAGASAASGAAALLWGAVRLAALWRGERGSAEEDKPKVPSGLTPLSLFILGTAFCMVEITSAAPYFGFLALLAGYDLAFPAALSFMLVYDFMYLLPLIVLYFGYNRWQGTTVIQRAEHWLGKVSAYVVPGAVTALGAVLLGYGLQMLW